MGGCAAPNFTNSDKKGFRLFIFPNEENRKRRWIVRELSELDEYFLWLPRFIKISIDSKIFLSCQLSYLPHHTSELISVVNKISKISTLITRI